VQRKNPSGGELFGSITKSLGGLLGFFSSGGGDQGKKKRTCRGGEGQGGRSGGEKGKPKAQREKKIKENVRGVCEREGWFAKQPQINYHNEALGMQKKMRGRAQGTAGHRWGNNESGKKVFRCFRGQIGPRKQREEGWFILGAGRGGVETGRRVGDTGGVN